MVLRIHGGGGLGRRSRHGDRVSEDREDHGHRDVVHPCVRHGIHVREARSEEEEAEVK